MNILKKLTLLAVAIMVLSPVMVAHADEGDLANKPAYTKRFVVRSCTAYKNAEQNSRNIMSLERVVTQLNKQVLNLENALAKQTAEGLTNPDLETLINKKKAEKTELEAHIMALRSTEEPAFCYDLYQKQAQAQLVKAERTLTQVTKSATALEAKQNAYNVRAEQSLTRVETQISTLQSQMASTTDARKLAALERKELALEKQVERMQAQTARYNTGLNSQVEAAQLRVETAQTIVSELKEKVQNYSNLENGSVATQVRTQSESNLVIATMNANAKPETPVVPNMPTEKPETPVVPEKPETPVGPNMPTDKPETPSYTVDNDGDGLPNAMETALGINPDNTDSDNDGYSDGEEVKNGFNPLGEGRMGDLMSAKAQAEMEKVAAAK